MRYGSLCSGIEAASVAWGPLGWTPAFFSEIEDFPSAVLAHHYPDTPNLGDMTKFKNWPKYAIDVLVGGTPCQAFSIAGLRKGLADPRGNLALTFIAIVDRYRPKWVVWENVPGVHSSWSDAETFAASEESGEIIEAARRAVESAGIDLGADFISGDFEECDQTSDFDCFLAGLAELGYGIATRVLDAQYVRVESHPRAVPQRRRRVFVVGYLGDWRRAAAVLFERACLSGNPPPRREAGKGATGTLAARTSGGGGLGTDFDLGGGLTTVQCGEIVPQAMSSKWSKGTSGPAGDEVRDLVAHSVSPGDARTLLGKANSSHAEDQETYVARSLTGEGFDASEDGSGRGTPIVAQTVTADMYRSGAVAGNNDQGVKNCIVAPFDTTQITSKANRSNPQPGDACHPLTSEGHPPAIAFRAAGQDGFTPSNVSPPIAATDGGGAGAPCVAIQDGRSLSKAQNGSGISDDGAGYTIDTKGAQAVMTLAIRGRGDSHQIETREDGTATAILTPNGGRAGIGVGAICARMAVRRLTPKECSRLQGFPDDYLDITFRGKPAADGNKYRALGNSMATNVMFWIGQRIQDIESL